MYGTELERKVFMRCSDCRFWNQKPEEDENGKEYYVTVYEDELGECRRYAPKPITYPACDTIQENCGYENFVIWPLLAANEKACGDFKRKPS
jgi:hypothetical protein